MKADNTYAIFFGFQIIHWFLIYNVLFIFVIQKKHFPPNILI